MKYIIFYGTAIIRKTYRIQFKLELEWSKRIYMDEYVDTMIEMSYVFVIIVIQKYHV